MRELIVSLMENQGFDYFLGLSIVMVPIIGFLSMGYGDD
jgi:hypothetical protein